MAKSSIQILLCLSLCAFALAQDWSYHDKNNWGDTYPLCGSGQRQSPINIQTSQVVPDQSLANDKLVYEKYDGKFVGKLQNHGLLPGVQFWIDPSTPTINRPRVFGGGFGGDVYAFEQFHFHMGNSSCRGAGCQGSEHGIDGLSAPAEFHLTHFNTKYGSLANAVSHPDGLMIIGFLFDVVTDPMVVTTDLGQVASLVPSIADDDVVTSIDFGKLLPQAARDGSGQYYRYDGSLPWPPCTEDLIYSIYSDRLPILSSTLDALRSATKKVVDPVTKAVSYVPIHNTHRPWQPLTGRVVRTNKMPPPAPASNGLFFNTLFNNNNNNNNNNNINNNGQQNNDNFSPCNAFKNMFGNTFQQYMPNGGYPC